MLAGAIVNYFGGGYVTPALVLPETVNIGWTPWVDFKDAFIYRNSGMVEYPRRMNFSLEGKWPLFGRRHGFMRDFVTDELRDLDLLADNPLRDIGETSTLRVEKTYYRPEQMVSVAYELAELRGTAKMEGYTPESIIAVQAGMHMRRIGNA